MQGGRKHRGKSIAKKEYGLCDGSDGHVTRAKKRERS